MIEHQYKDMYALFRHDRNAEEYFDELPSHIQDRIRPRYQWIDSFERLISLAEGTSRF